ncbi:MAG: alpha/beta fold hydrolase [Armatimonadetes bacterium]|nr:alpha/beta fold hydrolase [Armatimonadota bacterium]
MEIQVAFQSGDDQIFGVLHLPTGTPAPGLIMCHGFTGHKAEAHRLFVAAARDFASHGLAVLRFDFRGSGDSGGDFKDMTVSREIEDAVAALDFLAARPEVRPDHVGVLGLSLGGCVAACLAGRDSRVRALVLWSAAAHPARLAERLRPQLQGGLADIDGWAVGNALLDDIASIDPLTEVSRFTGPSLVVHGTEDQSVPVSDASDYRVALGGRCALHLMQGADHVYSTLAFTAEAIEVSRSFMVQGLGQ